MRKIFIITMFLINGLLSFATGFSVKDDFKNSQLIIFDSDERVSDKIPYALFKRNCSFVATNSEIIMVGNTNRIVRYSFEKKEIMETEIPCDRMFSLSPDMRYIAVAIGISVNTPSEIENVTTTKMQYVPVLYDFSTQKKTTEFNLDFLNKNDEELMFNLFWDETRQMFCFQYFKDVKDIVCEFFFSPY